LAAGYKVKVFDKLMFGRKSIEKLLQNHNFQFIQGDLLNIRELEKEIFDVDAVIHLAAIVGEAACVARQDLAIRTNYSGTIQVARLCKSYGIKRFIYTSTCSTYGKIEEENAMKEEASSRPVDFYGETKIYAERELLRLMDENFKPTILRLSTLYGISPRMRLDLVVNTFTKKAIKDKKIFVFGGNQWRPLIHVSDAARAIQLSLEAPLSIIGGQFMNVGDNRENYLILEVGKLIKECIPGTEIEFINDIKDNRSYQVNFDRIEKLLNFHREKTVKDGILEISQAIKEGRLRDLENKLYYNHLAINSD
jgi:nucleoside-diphosphate-sugar epimerase